MTVKVVTDSSACLPPALAAEYGITVLDFHAEGKGDEETTAGLGALELTACYARLLERGGDDGVVAVHISKELSGTWSSASQAASVLGDTVAVLDTQSAGMVVGQAAIAAARCADEGGSLDECRGVAQQAIDSGHLWLFLGKTDAMARGGRLSAGQRLLSTALAIKPILHLTGGKLELVAKTRTQAKAMDRLVTLVEAEYRAVAEAAAEEADAEAADATVAAASSDEVSVQVTDAAGSAAAADDADDAESSTGAAAADTAEGAEPLEPPVSPEPPEDSEDTGDSVAADSDPEVPDSESDSDSDGDSDDVADSESGTPAASDSEAQVTVDTEPVYRPRIFSFGSKDKGDRSDKAEKDKPEKDKAEKAERAEKEKASKERADKSDKSDKADKDKADHQVPLADLPRVPMHLAVHHNEAEEVAEQLRASLRETLPGCVVISVVDVTHSMAVHTGPGAVGVSLVRD